MTTDAVITIMRVLGYDFDQDAIINDLKLVYYQQETRLLNAIGLTATHLQTTSEDRYLLVERDIVPEELRYIVDNWTAATYILMYLERPENKSKGMSIVSSVHMGKTSQSYTVLSGIAEKRDAVLRLLDADTHSIVAYKHLIPSIRPAQRCDGYDILRVRDFITSKAFEIRGGGALILQIEKSIDNKWVFSLIVRDKEAVTIFSDTRTLHNGKYEFTYISDYRPETTSFVLTVMPDLVEQHTNFIIPLIDHDY